MLTSMLESIYSDSNTELFEAEDPMDKDVSPEGDTPLEDTPAAADVNAPAEAIISQDYVQKSVIFMFIIAVVIFFIRRRRQTQRDSGFGKSVV